MTLPPLPIRARLTLWNLAVLSIVLVGFSFGVLIFQRHYSGAQLDQELTTLSTAVATSLRGELAEGRGLAHAAAELHEGFNIPSRTIAIFAPDGRAIAAHWRGFRRASLLPFPRERVQTATVLQDALPWRVHVERHDSPTGPFTIVVAASESVLTREQHLLVKTLLVATPLALLFAALVCWWAASRALAPVTAMSRDAEQITLQSLDTRLSGPDRRDELGQLRRAFDRLLDRVAAGVSTQRRFMADASHELRTPVSAIRAAVEVTLSQPHRDEEEYRDALGVVLVQTERLGRMVEDMLTLARADAGGYRVRRRACSVSGVVEEAIETAQLLASAKRITIASRVDPAVVGRVDDMLVRQLALNLIENAIKHTPDDGAVTVSLDAIGGSAAIAVSDTGPGIPPAERERIFERFVRLDEARGDTSGGAGLGLSIARWIAQSHDGTLTLEQTGPSGSTFVAHLPHCQ